MARYSQQNIHRLINESDNAVTTTIKGAKLEELVQYIFNKIPGVTFYARNVLDGLRAHELDVVFTNDTTRSKLPFLDYTLITECKNTASRLSGHDTRWFISKLQDRGLSSGILISLSGITGIVDGVSCAHSEVLNALTRDKIKVLLIDRNEIMSLTTTEDLVNILQAKLLRLTIERTL